MASKLSDRSKGMVCIIFSAFCFAFMNVFVRLAGDLPSVQKSFFRNVIALIISFIAVMRNGGVHIEKRNLPFLFMRSVFGTAGILCNFYAIDHLVISDASMLNKMSPFFSILFSYFLLRERLTLVQGTLVGTAFCGALFIIKPSAEIFGNPAALVGLFGGISAGIAYTGVRVLGQQGANKSMIVLFFSAFSCLVTLPFIIFGYVPMTLRQLMALIGAGTSACGGQFGITSAYCYCPAKEISIYDYSQLIFAMVLGFIFFGQLPDALSFVGYGIIVVSAVVMFFYNKKKA